MKIQLSEKAAQIVKAQVSSGTYEDAASFISDILFKYDAYSKRKLENLNKEIVIGLEQANRGESVEFDFEELMQEVDSELGYSADK